ncbi:hypothetical protein GCM10023205_28220 [Yinghuangia aomiensis]|uniref:Uncharacterized protein n=1 Tax=Yinghuangia aomiensis TaxID=676205 RepID=A0ABP9H753_9ACTN
MHAPTGEPELSRLTGTRTPSGVPVTDSAPAVEHPQGKGGAGPGPPRVRAPPGRRAGAAHGSPFPASLPDSHVQADASLSLAAFTLARGGTFGIRSDTPRPVP